MTCALSSKFGPFTRALSPRYLIYNFTHRKSNGNRQNDETQGIIKPIICHQVRGLVAELDKGNIG